MSFFSKEPKQVDLALDSCESYLKERFEAISSPVINKCSPILSRLASALDDFSASIEKFSRIEKDPDEEFAGRMSISFIKTQKPKYIESLNNSISSLNEALQSIKYDTKYEDIRGVQVTYADFISRLLSINANFKGVVMGYSEEMKLFKKPFQLLEKNLKDLDYELNKFEQGFRSYIALKDEIGKAVSLKNELHIYAEEPDKPMSDSNSESLEAEKSEIEGKLNTVKGSILNLENKYNSIRSEIELVLKPLERAARKYDHLSSKKTSLANIISSPISSIGSELSYDSFIMMLKEMGAKISDKSIKIDNATQVLDQINDALNAGIDSAIAEAKSLAEQKAELISQEKDYENRLYETRKKAINIESAHRSRVAASEHRVEISMRIENAKATIEKMFMQYYNSKVHITD
ncbi:MAG: hypothetical protein QW814_02175 [Methanothrix sp.]